MDGMGWDGAEVGWGTDGRGTRGCEAWERPKLERTM